MSVGIRFPSRWRSLPALREALTTFVLSAVAAVASVTASPPDSSLSLQRGDVVFSADFEGTEALSGWTGPATLQTGYAGTQSAALARKDGRSSAIIIKTLPVDPLRGLTLRASAMVKAQDVSAKPNSWNGIKLMLVLHATGGSSSPQAPLDTGTFDWRQVTFSTRIPADVTNVTLVLGLENVTGKAWFDDVKLTVRKPRVIQTPQPVPGPRFKGHALPRLRGAMISSGIDPDSLKVLGRDWQGWSVEHGSDAAVTTPAKEPTDRERLLRDWFSKNAKPW